MHLEMYLKFKKKKSKKSSQIRLNVKADKLSDIIVSEASTLGWQVL